MKSFKSSALGEPHEYRCRFSDQLRLASAVLHADASASLMCKGKGDGDFKEVGHDQVQLRAVLNDMEADEDGDHAAQHKAASHDDDKPAKESHISRRKK